MTTAWKVWAKTEPFRPLPCHLIDAGQVALALSDTPAFRPVLERLRKACGCPTSARMRSWAAYLIALHDIGKCHADFQARGPAEFVAALEAEGLCCVVQQPGFRHEAMSKEWLHAFLQQQWGWRPSSARTASQVAAGHHGDFRVDPPMPEVDSQAVRWNAVRNAVEEIVRNIFRPEPWTADFVDHSTAGVLLCGLQVLSDWIASNEKLFRLAWAGQDVADYARQSEDQAREIVSRLGFDDVICWPAGQSFVEAWSAKQLTPRPIQIACETLSRSRPGLAIIEASMGEGKTEAALYLAAQWIAQNDLGGFYVALPTAATSNQMYGRVRDFLEPYNPRAAAGVRLVHGMAWLVDEVAPEVSPELSGESQRERDSALDWFRPRKRSLLAPYAVGTVDQAMMSVLHVRHSFLRLLGLAGGVLIMDEVHAYDTYMTEIISLLIRWCAALDIPVILLSATLPAARRQELVAAYCPGTEQKSGVCGKLRPYPLITYARCDGPVEERPVESSGRAINLDLVHHDGLLNDPSGTASAVVQALRGRGGCFVVIANTVGSAQAIYCELRRRLEQEGRSDVRCLLFHARFRAQRRSEIEETALSWFDARSLLPADDARRTERPGCAVLVATQVVEQSLDLDFDEMFSQLAPVDLLLQRSGRLHRHRRPERPTGPRARLHLLMPSRQEVDFGSTGLVYDDFILLRTYMALCGTNEWRLPEMIRALVEDVYDFSSPLPGEEAWGQLRQRVECARIALEQDMREQRRLAETYLVPAPYAARFKLATPRTGTFDEDEGEADSYFTARTRLGDETWRVVLLDDARLDGAVARKEPPDRQTMHELLCQMVSLPRWWFAHVSPADGFEPLREAPTWMPGARILRLHSGCWEGCDRRGRRFVVRDDSELGIVREEGGE